MKKYLWLLLVFNSLTLAQLNIPAKVIAESCSLYISPRLNSATYMDIHKNDKVVIRSVVDDFFRVTYWGEEGYVFNKDIENYEQILAEFDLIKKHEEDSIKAEIEKLKKELMTTLNSKFGKKIAKKIYDSEIWIGMTSEMTLYSYGKPDNINKYVNSKIVQETWYYYDRGITLNFVNDKLESWWE